MEEIEPGKETLVIPTVGDIITGTFGGNLPHLVVTVSQNTVEAGAIHTHINGSEEMTPVGTIRFSEIREIIDHWSDVDRITEAVANNMYQRCAREDEVPRIRAMVMEWFQPRIT